MLLIYCSKEVLLVTLVHIIRVLARYYVLFQKNEQDCKDNTRAHVF